MLSDRLTPCGRPLTTGCQWQRRSCIPIHARRCLPDPNCLSYPSGMSLCLSVDHFCLVTVDDMVLWWLTCELHCSPLFWRLGSEYQLWKRCPGHMLPRSVCASWMNLFNTNKYIHKAVATRTTTPVTSEMICLTATSPIRHLTASSRTAPPAQLLWPTGFLCGWSVGLEFLAGEPAESSYWREWFQTISENVSVCNVLMHLALYNSTFYLLTYLLHAANWLGVCPWMIALLAYNRYYYYSTSVSYHQIQNWSSTKEVWSSCPWVLHASVSCVPSVLAGDTP